MAALNSKYHIKIGDFGFLLAKQPRVDRHIYTREEAPHFVNKFSSGEPNYRDSTFFPHWVQLNWLNGFNQEFFDDGGKFYRSSAVDPTQQQKLKLQKKFSSAGNIASGVKVLAQESWRASSTSYFGDGSDGVLTIAADTTDAPIDSAFTGTSGATTGSATNASFAAGQQVLIHQTQGTGAGIYQKNKILSYSAGTVGLETPFNIGYVTGAQILVLKQYSTVTINSGKLLTAKAWNGTVGGILAFLCSGTCTVTGTLLGTGKGFRGGVGDQQLQSSAMSGESSTSISLRQETANGAGGAGGHNGGGGGGDQSGAGGGYGAGGTAGSSGSGGGAVVGVATLTTLFMGAGGGAGGGGTKGNGKNGGAGGAIILPWALTLTVTGAITSGGDAGIAQETITGDTLLAGGGGSGGSILPKTQVGTLGTGLITAPGGAGGSTNGGAGGVGRIHLDYLTSYTGTTTPTLDFAIDSSLTNTPAGSGFTHIVGGSNGKVYSWDGASVYTELFDARRLEWFETGTDANKVIGDTGGTETAQAQSFKVDAACKMKAVEVYLKKAAGTPGAITVTIETNSTDKPSGTLLDASATATIPAFTTATYGWITVEFPASFTAAAATSYWIVLKTAAAANDTNYNWAAKSTSGYADGTMAVSTDGGSTWAAVAGADAYFRVLGNSTSVNVLKASTLSGTNLLYIGTGDPSGVENGDAKLFSWNGTAFTLVKIFNNSNESSLLCMREFGTTPKMYLGFGHKAKIYSSTDMATFTLSKTITVPNNPGYVYDMTEYNNKLMVGGGFPEQLPGNNFQYSGFLYSYDDFAWVNVSPFEFTVIKSLEVYDTLLFIGTINKRLYVYNTASVDKLFEFPWAIQITRMFKWDDKLALAIAPTPGSAITGNEGIYLFDRNGFHNAFNLANSSWYSVFTFNNNLMAGDDQGNVYQTSANTYQATGNYQSSYDEAQLPSIEKIRRSVTLIYEALPTGCTILVEYKTDEADSSWTSLGTASVVASTNTTFNFSSGVYCKKISFRVTLATTVAGSTPTLKKILHKYVLSPDFKYLWKMKLLCADNIMWQDGTEPAALLSANVSAGATSITLKSSDDASPTAGFPDPNGGVMYASIINPDTGVYDQFTYTGITSTTLTGIPATGSLAIGAHSANDPVKVRGGDLHQKILDLKQTRQLFTFTDIDSITYTVLFNSFQEDAFAINQDDFYGGLENEVPITLLEA